MQWAARARRGDELTPSGTLQRRLLALLALHRGNVVTTDTAIEALWPRACRPTREPPCRTTCHGCVASSRPT